MDGQQCSIGKQVAGGGRADSSGLDGGSLVREGERKTADSKATAARSKGGSMRKGGTDWTAEPSKKRRGAEI